MTGIAGRAVTSTSAVAIHARDAETRGPSVVDMTSTEGLMEEARHSGSPADPMFDLETGTALVGPTTSLVVPTVSGAALSKTTLSTLLMWFVHRRILAA